jgi:hypothetical protein
VENIEKTLEKLDINLSENYRVTLSIKERLDKQNGAIPHLVEDVKELKHGQTALFDAIVKNSISDTENKTRVKILWGILATIGTAAIGFAIKLLSS